MCQETSKELSPMEDLAGALGEQVKCLADYFRSTERKQPSLSRSTTTVLLPEDAPQDAHIARQKIMEASLKLFRLAAGPSEYLASMQTSYHYVACLQWLCRFKIFSLVPLDASISYAALANLANVSEARLKSVVRMAITDGLFEEPSPLYISHSATSALLCTDENFYDWAVFLCDISVPTAMGMAEAHSRWSHDFNKAHTAYNVAFDHDMPFFEHLAQTPVRHKQFAGYMRSVTTNQGTHMKHLVSGFDWADLGKGLVVDVGGSTGQASVALAMAYADLEFLVQDLSEVVADGERYLSSLDGGTSLSKRISFQPHSFFEAQNVLGADIYLLRMILHDWAFDDAVKILAQLVPALERRSRIIIMDTVLPGPASVPAVKERLLRVRDLTMMQVFNSQERAIEDWISIFAKVDQRLQIQNVTQPFGSLMSLIELKLVDACE